jgi:hypothetical protein
MEDAMNNFRVKYVGTLSRAERHIRLFRVMWERGRVGDGRGYSVKLAIGLVPRMFTYDRGVLGEVTLSIAGLRVHYRRSYGGIFV